MKISIVGLGTMGRIVLEQAGKAGVEVFSTIDPMNPEASFKQIDAKSVESADACICFTHPSVALENIADLCKQGKNIVMATTGWDKYMEQVRKQVEEAGIGMIYSSNFSLGVNIYFRILESALQLVNKFDDYDVMGWEMHHNRKVDAPSGTAKTIERSVLEHFTRKKQVVEDRPDGRLANDAFHFASIRGGDIPGDHTIRFDSEFDSITLAHSARNRNGFAKGALLAASWISGKKGLFTEKDLIDAYLTETLQAK